MPVDMKNAFLVIQGSDDSWWIYHWVPEIKQWLQEHGPFSSYQQAATQLL